MQHTCITQSHMLLLDLFDSRQPLFPQINVLLHNLAMLILCPAHVTLHTPVHTSSMRQSDARKHPHPHVVTSLYLVQRCAADSNPSKHVHLTDSTVPASWTVRRDPRPPPPSRAPSPGDDPSKDNENNPRCGSPFQNRPPHNCTHP